jgi:hypothetical protein
MIYLFNSAFRPRYVRNVLNTLYLPEHCANEYRYRFIGEKPNISAGFFSELEGLKPGTECVVIFIDRYAKGGYEYHPLRKARFLRHRVVADYLYLKVELLDFIYPQNLQQFQESLLAQVKGMPCLTNGEPEYQHDGYYAIESDSVFGHLDDFKRNDDAWTSAVTALSATRAMRTDDEQWPIFLKVAIHPRKDRTSLAPITQDQTPLFQLTKDRVFELVLTYKFPQQRRNNTSQCRIDVRLGENIRALGASSFMVDSVSNSAIVSFTTRRYATRKTTEVTLSWKRRPRPNLKFSSLMHTSSTCWKRAQAFGFR